MRLCHEIEWSTRPRRLFCEPRCQTYDTSTANPVNPQGTAGGGNSFNVAPLFGSVYGGNSATSSGNNPANTTNKDTAALGGPATSSDIPVPGTPAASAVGQLSAFFTANKSLILAGLGITGVLFLAGFLVKTFRKS